MIPASDSLPARSAFFPSGTAVSWLWSIAAAILVFFAYTQHAQFPYYYHTDEPGKANQILSGERNFHHPLLLLRTAEVLLDDSGKTPDKQSAIESGRRASALFAAGAVLALSLLAAHLAGLRAAVLAALLLALHPVFFELAHYCKEDCAYVFGLGWFFLALAWFCHHPTYPRIFLLGACLGLAISGKYIGIVLLAAALPALIVTAIQSERARYVSIWCACLVFSAFAVFAIINWESLRDYQNAQAGLDSEFVRMDAAVESKDRFRIRYLSTIGVELSLPVLLAVGWLAWHWWRKSDGRPDRRLALGILMVFPTLYFFMMSVAPRTKERYLLPVFLLFCVLAAVGWAIFYARAHGSGRRWAWAVLGFAILWPVPRLVQSIRDFSSDPRQELLVFLRDKIEADTTVACDGRVFLPLARESAVPGVVFPQKLLAAPKRMVAERGSLDDLFARGVRYVAICEPDYSQIVRADPDKWKPEDKRRRLHDFYTTLMAKGERVWHAPPSRIAYIHPGLSLYRLPNSSDTEHTSPAHP